MGKARKFSPEFKFQLMLEIVSGYKSLAAVSREHRIKDTVLQRLLEAVLRVLYQRSVAAADAGQMNLRAGRRQRLQQQIAVAPQIGLVQRAPGRRQPAIVALDLRDDIFVVRMGRQLRLRNEVREP